MCYYERGHGYWGGQESEPTWVGYGKGGYGSDSWGKGGKGLCHSPSLTISYSPGNDFDAAWIRGYQVGYSDGAWKWGKHTAPDEEPYSDGKGKGKHAAPDEEPYSDGKGKGKRAAPDKEPYCTWCGRKTKRTKGDGWK